MKQQLICIILLMVLINSANAVNVTVEFEVNLTTTVPITTTVHATTLSSSGGGSSGTTRPLTTSSTIEIFTTTLVSSTTTSTTLPIIHYQGDEDEHRLFEGITTIAVVYPISSEQSSGLIYFLFNTSKGLYVMLISVVVIILSVIFVVQWKKRSGIQNPFQLENQGI